jgi:hypothetical protein
VHRAGEKAFLDYSGKKPRIVDRTTGEATEVELFVAVLGASNLTYAEVTRTQRLTSVAACWCGHALAIHDATGRCTWSGIADHRAVACLPESLLQKAIARKSFLSSPCRGQSDGFEELETRMEGRGN